ncbi:nucleotidyltransferase family protein [Klebsiella sp. I138]|uniref:nucleotidyltransferase family protein n=1 Tax=Klebsiella sp. I138 TaxID=2755385 RepID=UPI003DAA2DAF
MRHLTHLKRILRRDNMRMQAMESLRSLGLESGWIGAGFVRDAVWDDRHRHGTCPITGDVDVLFWAESHSDTAIEIHLEQRLRHLSCAFDWSVRNQARMHIRNGDTAYDDIADAMRYWPETATAVAVRLNAHADIEVLAPFGLDDLFGLILRPTPRFQGEKYGQFQQRIAEKQWLTRYPHLQLLPR